MSKQGWVALHRKFLEWEWYDDKNTKILFLHLLLKANHKDNRWQGVLVKRGQLISGRFKLSKEVGLSEQQTRTAINKLISTNEITKLSTTEYTIYTLTNYNRYQDINQQDNQRATNEQPTSNH